MNCLLWPLQSLYLNPNEYDERFWRDFVLGTLFTTISKTAEWEISFGRVVFQQSINAMAHQGNGGPGIYHGPNLSPVSNSNGLISVNCTSGLPNYTYTLYSTILDLEQISLSHFAHFLLVKM